jgi:hypothetical protein
MQPCAQAPHAGRSSSPAATRPSAQTPAANSSPTAAGSAAQQRERDDHTAHHSGTPSKRSHPRCPSTPVHRIKPDYARARRAGTGAAAAAAAARWRRPAAGHLPCAGGCGHATGTTNAVAQRAGSMHSSPPPTGTEAAGTRATHAPGGEGAGQPAGRLPQPKCAAPRLAGGRAGAGMVRAAPPHPKKCPARARHAPRARRGHGQGARAGRQGGSIGVIAAV